MSLAKYNPGHHTCWDLWINLHIFLTRKCVKLRWTLRVFPLSFDPNSNVLSRLPHPSSHLCRLSAVLAPRQHLYLPSPPAVRLPFFTNPQLLAGGAFMFAPLSSYFLVHGDRQWCSRNTLVHTAVSCISALRTVLELLSTFFKSTHSLRHTHTLINHVKDAYLPKAGLCSQPRTPFSLCVRAVLLTRCVAADKLACLVPSWLR